MTTADSLLEDIHVSLKRFVCCRMCPNNAALTSKGPMFPSILEVRGGQAGKEARTKKTQHLPPKKSFVLLSKTSKYIKCADAFTTEYLWTCSQPEDKEKFSSAASLLSFGLNVH